MKKKISVSILSVAFLSGLFVNISFAERPQTNITVSQKKASNLLHSENQQNPNAVALDNVSVKDTIHADSSNQLRTNKKTGREKTIEFLKKYTKDYNETQQRLIRQYENMTDKEIRWDKIKKFFMRACIFCGTVGSLVGALIGTYCLGLKWGFDDGYDSFYWYVIPGETPPKDFGYKKGEDRQKCRGEKNGFNQGYADGLVDADKCNYVVSNTSFLFATVLTILKPDSFPKEGKNFNDVKEVYYNLTNFYDEYLK